MEKCVYCSGDLNIGYMCLKCGAVFHIDKKNSANSETIIFPVKEEIFAVGRSV